MSRNFLEVQIDPLQLEKEKIQFNKKYSALFNLRNRTIIGVSGQDSTTLSSINDYKWYEDFW